MKKAICFYSPTQAKVERMFTTSKIVFTLRKWNVQRRTNPDSFVDFAMMWIRSVIQKNLGQKQ